MTGSRPDYCGVSPPGAWSAPGGPGDRIHQLNPYGPPITSTMPPPAKPRLVGSTVRPSSALRSKRRPDEGNAYVPPTQMRAAVPVPTSGARGVGAGAGQAAERPRSAARTVRPTIPREATQGYVIQPEQAVQPKAASAERPGRRPGPTVSAPRPAKLVAAVRVRSSAPFPTHRPCPGR